MAATNLGVIGAGYVGLVSGACFADSGYSVLIHDVDATKIRGLREGQVPFYEPGLSEVVTRNTREGRLSFSSRFEDVIETSDVIFIAVGTPSGVDGSPDMRYVEDVVHQLATYRSQLNGKVVVLKSTVPVGTNQWAHGVLNDCEQSQNLVHVVSNPEFLREGKAVWDFRNPDRVVLGCRTSEAETIMRGVYAFVDVPIVVVAPPAAEMIKYAANAFLATKISFINEIANICDHFGIRVVDIAQGIGLDRRISPHFLQAGLGYGGSCFPKDVKGLIAQARSCGQELSILVATENANANRRQRFVDLVRRAAGGSLAGKRVAVWGISFKPETDDIREAPFLTVAEGLLAAGATVMAYDPAAMENAARVFGPDRVRFCDSAKEALDGADVLALVTEWVEFVEFDPQEIVRLMRTPVIVDGRNALDRGRLQKAGVIYHGFGN